MGCRCSRGKDSMGNVTKITMIKVHYMGDFEEPFVFVGASTKTSYKFGGQINLSDVDSRDLATGVSTRPGLFELTDGKGQKIFELWTSQRAEEERERMRAEMGAEEPPDDTGDIEIVPSGETDGEDTLPGD